MRQNCILDENNIIKIPQNELQYFIIKKSKNWKNSIDIEFDIKKDIDILNLFIIIKSYIKNIEFFCFKMSTIVKKNDDEKLDLEIKKLTELRKELEALELKNLSLSMHH